MTAVWIARLKTAWKWSFPSSKNCLQSFRVAKLGEQNGVKAELQGFFLRHERTWNKSAGGWIIGWVHWQSLNAPFKESDQPFDFCHVTFSIVFILQDQDRPQSSHIFKFSITYVHIFFFEFIYHTHLKPPMQAFETRWIGHLSCSSSVSTRCPHQWSSGSSGSWSKVTEGCYNFPFLRNLWSEIRWNLIFSTYGFCKWLTCTWRENWSSPPDPPGVWPFDDDVHLRSCCVLLAFALRVIALIFRDFSVVLQSCIRTI